MIEHSHSRPFRAWQRWSLAVAIAGMATCVALSWERPENFWRAYLAAYMLCWPVTLGAAGLLAIGNLTGGAWAGAARPAYVAAARTMPLIAVLFVPIALSLEEIYPWAATSETIKLSLPAGKAAYLAPTSFLLRAGCYLGIWIVVVALLNHVSRPASPPASTSGMRRAGALALVLLVPTATFAAFDWAMSLEPLWYSSIYGAIVIAGGVLAAHALAICTMVEVRANNSSTDTRIEQAAQLFNDLGNLLLAYFMVFVYLTFSQFLIIWSGNLPAEITWYLRRLNGGWQWLALAMSLIGITAFFQMLFRDRKRTPRHLLVIAVLVLLVYGIHTYWMVVPAFHQSGLAWQATNIAAVAALAGGWMTAYCWHARRCCNSFEFNDRMPQVE